MEKNNTHGGKSIPFLDTMPDNIREKDELNSLSLNLDIFRLMQYVCEMEQREISWDKVQEDAERIVNEHPGSLRAKEAQCEVLCMLGHISYLNSSKNKDGVLLAYELYERIKDRSISRNLHRLAQDILLDWCMVTAGELPSQEGAEFLVEHLTEVDRQYKPYAAVQRLKAALEDPKKYQDVIRDELVFLEKALDEKSGLKDCFGLEEAEATCAFLKDKVYTEAVSDPERQAWAKERYEECVQRLYVNRDTLNNYYMDLMCFVHDSLEMLKAEYGLPWKGAYWIGHKVPVLKSEKKGRKKNGKYNKGLLCLHGFGGDKDSTVIRNLIPCFSGCGFNIVAFDWPAHGESEMADEELTVENCLADLNYLVESMHRDYEEVDCFATSFGGYLATLYRNEHPDAFCRLVLRSPALRMDRVFRTLIGEEDFARLEAGGVLEIGFERKMTLDKSFYEGLTAHDAYIPAPPDPQRILILQGDADDVVPPEDIRTYAEKNHIRVEWFQGTDHRYKKPGEMEHILLATREFLIEGTISKE